MVENKLEIDLNQILVDVIKLDRNLQDSVKRMVTEEIIHDITERLLAEYYETRWNSDKKQIRESVVSKLSKDREEFIIKIIKDFTEKLSYFSKDKRVKAYESFKKSVDDLLKDKSF